ncbi:MAG: NYN domain-containing protein [Candidatus Aminicenantes bacterium]|nr:NYN domain-containing protein [Candidatus Aminicenantes bacterium]
MSYIVDGSNVLGRAGRSVRDPAEKMDLARRLSLFQRQTRARVILVFDGPADAALETPPPSPGLRTLSILFPPDGCPADDLIRDILDGRRDNRDVVLVTSDRELSAYGRRRGARVSACAAFARELRGVLRDFHRARASRKPETKPPSGLDLRLWLDVFKDAR